MADHSDNRPVTLTHPLSPRWLERPDGYRHFESAYFVGHGKETFDRCAEELLHWEVKIRSGFDIEVNVDAVHVGSADTVSRAAGAESTADVDARAGSGRPPRVEPGQEPTIRVRLGPFRLPEPSRVIDVVDTEDRCGFTYGTKPGHPITGEESFILIRTADDRVFLVLRSVSRAGQGIWRLGEPFVRLAQIVYRRRYGRALRS
ncbi:DUF1990 family protein [Brevibacterium linens]|uniref:Uncharacterized protein, UPF0548 family n=1 Tax=Brevibacterium linens ATCC 9172 TaxID=1255617 RepID=A0A2H1ITV1_BRELN|nr:DUF1990 domain-containing protein [Brevibacterium linens]AZU02088.1 DUF1990 domain-containing protein [Brevibacterium linens]KAB1948815.1 DUF1990 domain-containing protein [Brevibacterium linens ATCC 9172]SMX78541.1 Uncharacterized protein, UPF0548 family [Brevibacterium linens ATCC 9172]